MAELKVTDCRLNPNGLFLKVEDARRGKQYELYSVKLVVTELDEDVQIFPFGRKQKSLTMKGYFSSKHPANQIKECEPLEVTLEDIEKQFGRKVKIVNTRDKSKERE